MSALVFDGKRADAFGLRIGGVNVYAAQGKEPQLYTVPGRIGAVYPDLDYSQMPNEIREYKAGLYLRNAGEELVQRRMVDIRHWLMNPKGYAELSDSYEPQLYRRAFFSGSFSPVRKGAGENYEIPLRFSCDPRRFIAGDNSFTINGWQGETTYTTPLIVRGFRIQEYSKPLLYISKDETVLHISFTDVTEEGGTPRNDPIGEIWIKAGDADFWFDAETLTAWQDDDDKTPCNDLISDVIGEVRLGSGQTKITLGNMFSLLRVNPRWWVR